MYFANDGIKPPEQRQGGGAPVWKIQRQRHAWARKPQNARRLTLPEGLEHRKKRSLARAADLSQHGGHGITADLPGHHALVLVKAAQSIHPVPVVQVVERIRERLIVDNASALPAAVEPGIR